MIYDLRVASILMHIIPFDLESRKCSVIPLLLCDRSDDVLSICNEQIDDGLTGASN